MRIGVFCIARVVLVLVTLVLSSLPLLAQLDQVLLKVSYVATFKLVEEATEHVEDEMVLEVGQTTRSFYPRWRRKRVEVMDSLKKAGVSGAEFLAEVNKYPTPKATYSVFLHLPKVGRLVGTDRVVKNTYVYEEQWETPQWVYLNETRTIMGYLCYAARCHYRGREWKAYYTLEIPVDAGPWKLSGLPGLILQADDDSGSYSFECVAIIQQDGTEVMYMPQMSDVVKCTRHELMQLQREFYINPDALMEKSLGFASKGWTSDGKAIKYTPKTALFLDY